MVKTISAAIWALVFLFACSSLFMSCKSNEKAPPWKPRETEEDLPQVECPEDETALICAGNWAVSCVKGEPDELVDCFKTDEVCAPYIGCSRCVPGRITCGGSNNVVQCSKDGRDLKEIKQCDASAGEHCDLINGGCADLCKAAEATKSYIGCEYWAVPTINSELKEAFFTASEVNPFRFAIAIANPQAVTADVQIERAGSLISEKSVEPGEMTTIELDWIPLLFDGISDQNEPDAVPRSVKVKDGAYRISSSVPVTAYQFNPLRFQEEVDNERYYSHTNDASLLLPTQALTGNYVVMSRPTRLVVSTVSASSNCGGSDQLPCYEQSRSSSPGFLAIVGVDDEPTQVQIKTTSYLVEDDNGVVPNLAPGEVLSLSLEKGEVLQLLSATPEECPENSYQDEISTCSSNRDAASEPCATFNYTYCDVDARYDLTGTQISASGRISVISGHNCAFVPHNRWACDHLEESMFPTESWGKEIFVALSEPIREEPNVIRVLSNSDENAISFSPEVYEKVSINAGEYIEFAADRDFRVRGTHALMVAQFLVGQDYAGFRSSGLRSEGDPGMSLGIPQEQWRERYTFLAPDTFPDSTVIVIARKNQSVVLDGRLVTGFRAIKGTAMSAARVNVESGQHLIEATATFGIVVYGYALYTSYIYPGGLDLRVINII
ncbi:MAG: IgGFc-binding protein [Deltaproteobacteria bacterium]|nr:IgGFc-binding protein [Deltaproteobacteria bacterium]